MINNILFKNNKYELGYDPTYSLGMMYIIIDGNRYELSCHSYEPCTYIYTQNEKVNIAMSHAFDLSFVINAFKAGRNYIGGNQYRDISPLRFCQIIDEVIMRETTQ